MFSVPRKLTAMIDSNQFRRGIEKIRETIEARVVDEHVDTALLGGDTEATASFTAS